MNPEMELPPRIVAEQRIITQMTQLYCRGNHATEQLCIHCRNLIALAHHKLAHCQFQLDKPTCRRCTSPCWVGDERESIRAVMRYAGPRFIFHFPGDLFLHLLHEYPAFRYLAIAFGWLFLALGVVGIVLPGVPTTPFVLLAAFLFAHSSQRFHRKLRNHPFLGRIIRTWERERAIPKGMKPKALLLFLSVISLSIYLAPILPVKIVLAIIAVTMGIVLIRIPESSEEYLTGD